MPSTLRPPLLARRRAGGDTAYLRDLKKRDSNKNQPGDLTHTRSAVRRAGIPPVKSGDRDVEAQAPAGGKGHVAHCPVSRPFTVLV